MKKIIVISLLGAWALYADNQTTDLSPVFVDAPLPFTISIQSAEFTLPMGIQSGAAAQCGSKYLFIAGRINGLHNFNNDTNNFPPNQQNTTVFVIDPCKKSVVTRSLLDPSSGLTQEQIDTLSVTSPQFYQHHKTLYITGGYGVDTSTGNFSTKDTLTAIDVPGLIHWVTHPNCSSRAVDYIRQISNPVFQVTGGHMFQVGKNPTLLMLGQNFTGFYTPNTTGDYTEQIRRFHIIDDGKCLNVIVERATSPDPNYRRRDLNIIPIIKFCCHKKKTPAFVALSGVFTESAGAWTVPIEISACGNPHMADPDLATTFKQGMNNYNSAHVELLSKRGNIYSILFGGITFEYYQDGQFFTDAELPFTNNVTVVKRNKNGRYQQYLLPTEYPTIVSTASNPGNVLLFGAGAKFMPAPDIHIYKNGVLKLKKIKKPTVIGYIIGGIQSTLPNTNSSSDSAASPYVFKVILTPTFNEINLS